jgi:hypothetical protein
MTPQASNWQWPCLWISTHQNWVVSPAYVANPETLVLLMAFLSTITQQMMGCSWIVVPTSASQTQLTSWLTLWTFHLLPSPLDAVVAPPTLTTAVLNVASYLFCWLSLCHQPCYYCKNATETIISPQAVVDASDTFVSWHQSGHKGGLPGMICFESSNGLL